MDIQVDFLQPNKIAQSVSDPDELIVKFTNSKMFLDQ